MNEAGGIRARLVGPGTVAVAAVVILLVVVVSLVLGRQKSEPVRQPIPFNHALHARMNATCDVCHRGFDTGQVAGQPVAAICAECHEPQEDPLGDSPTEELLRTFLMEGRAIPWQRLTYLPPDVRFSHALHAGKRQIPCDRCHGSLGQTESPPEEPPAPFTMDGCLACHEEEGASVDCLACHR